MKKPPDVFGVDFAADGGHYHARVTTRYADPGSKHETKCYQGGEKAVIRG